jgi:hypothetical protein
MNMFEKIVVTACPWIFAMVCVVAGLTIKKDGETNTAILQMVLICSGFIIMSLFCISYTLVRMVGKREQTKTAGTENSR